MGGACSTHGADQMHTEFWSGNPKGRFHSEGIGVDGKIISKWILLK